VGLRVNEVLAGSVKEYLDRLSSGSAVPGGGSAAALAAAMGVALVSMVATISARKARDTADGARLRELLPELDQLRADLGRLSQEDIDAYRGVMDSRKRGDAQSDLEEASALAAQVPLETARAADRGLAIFAEVSSRAWEMTRSDLDAGRALLEVGVRVALANVKVNLPDLAADARVRIELACAELESRPAQ
jgi:formiminotetrahydrofolate cyclodeaminase